MKICHSGGATGADTVFEKESIRMGWKVKAYSFVGHNTASTNRVIISQEQLQEGYNALEKVRKYLKRNTPSSLYVRQLISRNWFQVTNSDAIYAVSTIDEEGLVKGGTGWAVSMAILLKKCPVYVYDQNDDIWYKYLYDENIWNPLNNLFITEDNFAGIGSRELTPKGRFAIRDLIRRSL